MRPLTSRERWLIAIAIPATIGCVYFGGLRQDAVDRIANASGRIASLASGATESKPDSAGSDGASLETERSSIAQAMAGLRAQLANSKSRTELLRTIADALQSGGGVRLHRSSEVVAGETSPAIGGGLRAARTTLVHGGAESPILWRIDLRGPYSELRSAVARGLAVVGAYTPVGLELKKADGGPDLDLVLWMWL